MKSKRTKKNRKSDSVQDDFFATNEQDYEIKIVFLSC